MFVQDLSKIFAHFRLFKNFLNRKSKKCEKATLLPASRFTHSPEVMHVQVGVVERARWVAGVSENGLAVGARILFKILNNS